MLLVSPSDISVEIGSDASRLRLILQDHPLARGKVIVDVRIDRVRRYASRRLNPLLMSACYLLDMRDVCSGVASTHLLYGKVHRDRQSAQAVRTPTTYFAADCNLVLWSWPEDPGMPQLPNLLDTTCTRALCGVPDETATVVRYLPEQRATLRYALVDENGSSEAFVYAKSFADDKAHALDARFRYFFERARSDDTLPLVAEPLGLCGITRSFWQRQAPGRPLASAVSPNSAARLGAEVAQALSEIHSAPLDLAGAEVRDTTHWALECRRRAKKIGRALPAVVALVDQVVDLLTAHAGCHEAATLGLIHGDFHPGQLWIAAGRVVLFDFDEFCIGDPMEDLATLLVKLDDRAECGMLAESVRDAYRVVEPRRYCARRLRWFMALQHLLLASRAFVFQVPGWERDLERRLGCARDMFGTLEGGVQT